MFQLIFVFLISVSKQCSAIIGNQNYFITENESLRVNLTSLFVGQNITYSINEPEIKFALPINEQYPKTELPIEVSYLSFKAYQNQQRWLNQFAFMNSGTYFIEIAYTESSSINPLFQNLVIIDKYETELICFDFDYYNYDSFILDCNFLDQNHLFVFKNTGERLFIIEIQNNFTSQSRKILNYNQQFYVLQYSKTESVLDIYSWNEEKTILTEQIQFNSQFIREFLKNDTILLEIKGFHICSQHSLYFFDQNLGVFKWTDHLQFESGKIISFYCDTLSEFRVYLYHDKIQIVRDQIHKIMHHNITLGKDAEIQISGQYIVLHNKGQFYSFSLYSGVLLQQMDTEGILAYITSDNYLITLSNQYSHLYFLSHGYLILTKTNKEIVTFTVKGIDQTNTSCSVDVNLHSIGQVENQKLYELANKVPNVATTPSHPVTFPILASGPNQKYSCLQNCQISQQKDIQIKQIINYNSILYMDFKNIDEHNYFFLYQNENFTLIINSCQLDEQLNCVKVKQFPLNQQITKQNFQWIYHKNEIYIIYVENKTLMKIVSLTETIQQIQFEKEVISFFMDQNLYVVIQGSMLCYLDILGTQINKIIVDQIYMNKLGYNLTWNPSMVQIDNKRKLLFIVNDDYLLIANQIPNFSIKGIVQINKNVQITISISSSTFIIVQDNKLLEYSFEQDIYLLHELSLYNKELINPINMVSTDQYFLIQSTSNNILIYQFNTQAHDSLKLIFPIGYSSIPSQLILFAVSPHQMSTKDSDLLLLINYKSLNLKQIFNSPKIEFKNEELNHKDYVKETTIQVQIENEQNTIQISSYIKLLNTQTQLNILEKELREDNLLYLDKKLQTITLEKKWYEGQAISFDIKPEIEGAVKISNLLTLTNNTLDNTQQFNNFISKQIKILQATQAFLVFDKEQNLLNIVNLDINLQYTCIQTVFNDDFYLTLCNSETESQIHISRLSDGFALGFQIKLEYKTKKIELLGSNLIILSAHSVRMYKLKFEETFQLIDEIVFNADFVKYDGILQAVDFELTKAENNEYFLQILDISGIVVILRGQFIDDLYQPYSRVWYDTKQILSQKSFYLLDTTKFIGIKHLYFYANLILNIRLLLLTNNAGSYGLRFEYNDKLRIHLDFQIYQYGFWETVNWNIDGDLFGIQYSYEDKSLIGIYQIQYQQTQDSFEQHTIISGIQKNLIDDVPPFFFIQGKDIYVQDLGELIQYHINDFLTITVKGGLDRQHLIITSYNDFSNVTQDYIINYNIKYEKSNAWWIALICVIAGALIIAFAFYYYKRTHPVKSVSSILLE